MIEIETTQKRQIIDITKHVNDIASSNNMKAVTLQLLHTTAALTTADLDPGTDQDMLDAWFQMLPDIQWRHPHDPKHAPDHIIASLIGPSLTIVVKDSVLQLGAWQRIVLCEFNGPRTRKIVFSTT